MKSARIENHTPEADRHEWARIAAEEAAEERYEQLCDEVREERDWLSLIGDYLISEGADKYLAQAALEEGELRSTAMSTLVSQAIDLEAKKRVKAEGHNFY